MIRKTPILAIYDMLKSITTVEEIIQGVSVDEFVSSASIRLSAQKCIEIIGQAATTLSAEFKAKYPDIPWIQIINTRHRYVHEYHRVDFKIVWKVAKEELPKLKAQLEPIFTELERDL